MRACRPRPSARHPPAGDGRTDRRECDRDGRAEPIPAVPSTPSRVRATASDASRRGWPPALSPPVNPLSAARRGGLTSRPRVDLSQPVGPGGPTGGGRHRPPLQVNVPTRRAVLPMGGGRAGGTRRVLQPAPPTAGLGRGLVIFLIAALPVAEDGRPRGSQCRPPVRWDHPSASGMGPGPGHQRRQADDGDGGPPGQVGGRRFGDLGSSFGSATEGFWRWR